MECGTPLAAAAAPLPAYDVRKDDALHAIRAAAGMQAALERLNEGLRARYGVTLANRTGVNTGEVVANDNPGADQKLATGDAVNVAARLEQAAPENEVCLGEVTHRLVRDAVDVEAAEPLELKGKAQRVPAWRLVRVHGVDGLVRRHHRPLVGRDNDLATLRRLYAEVCGGRVARMATVIGDAGMGKSRLVREVIDAVATGAQVLSGRCLRYGDGITFWPLMTMVRDAAGELPTDSPEVARARVLTGVGDAAVADRLCSAQVPGDACGQRHGGGLHRRHPLGRAGAAGPDRAHPADVHRRAHPAAGHLAPRLARGPARLGHAGRIDPPGAAAAVRRRVGADRAQPAGRGRSAAGGDCAHRRGRGLSVPGCRTT